MRGGGRMIGAALLALLISAGAAGAVGGYYLQHVAARDHALEQDWRVVLRPLGSGAYDLQVPVPTDDDGNPAALTLTATGAPVTFSLLRTEYGPALRVQGDGDAGPVVLTQHGGLPLHLSMDDQRTSFPQFKFWVRLAEDSPAVNLTMALAQRESTQNWSRTARIGETIFFTQDLAPAGWQRVRAEHQYDIYSAGGTGQDFTRMLIGGVATGLGALYVPLGLVVVGSRKP